MSKNAKQSTITAVISACIRQGLSHALQEGSDGYFQYSTMHTCELYKCATLGQHIYIRSHFLCHTTSLRYLQQCYIESRDPQKCATSLCHRAIQQLRHSRVRKKARSRDSYTSASTQTPMHSVTSGCPYLQSLFNKSNRGERFTGVNGSVVTLVYLDAWVQTKWLRP